MTAAVVAARDVRQGGEGGVKSGFGNWDNTDDKDSGGEEGRVMEHDRGEILSLYRMGERKKEGTAATGGGRITAKIAMLNNKYLCKS